MHVQGVGEVQPKAIHCFKCGMLTGYHFKFENPSILCVGCGQKDLKNIAVDEWICNVCQHQWEQQVLVCPVCRHPKRSQE